MGSKLGPTIADIAIEQGKQIGQLLAVRTLLRALLEDRFGPVPETLLQRINSTEDLERLQMAVRRVYQVQSIEDLAL